MRFQQQAVVVKPRLGAGLAVSALASRGAIWDIDCMSSVRTRERLETGFVTGQESEYAAWTLANAFVLNHTTISVHRLSGLGCAPLSAACLYSLAPFSPFSPAFL